MNTQNSIVASLSSTLHIHPFGMQMPLRSYTGESYRFGYNTQEKLDEVAGAGNHYTAEFWEYSPRVVHRWNTDPVVKEWESPYAINLGNPIAVFDHLGDDGEYVNDENGKTIGYKGDVVNNNGDVSYVTGDGWNNEILQQAGLTPQPLSSDNSPYKAYNDALNQLDISDYTNRSEGTLYSGYTLKGSDLNALSNLLNHAPNWGNKILKDFQSGNIYPVTGTNFWNHVGYSNDNEMKVRLGMFGVSAWPATPNTGVVKPRGLNSPNLKVENVKLNSAQQSNINRFIKKAPANATSPKIRRTSSGDIEVSIESQGQVPGSKAVYTKIINKHGKTIDMFKTTYDPKGNIVHIKNKL